MTWEGIIPRKRRRTFEQFLRHEDPRIRALAEEMLKLDSAERAILRAEGVQDNGMSDYFVAEDYEGFGDVDREMEPFDDSHGLPEIPL